MSASVAGFLPGPGMAVYYASKAYVLSFSEALHSELKPRGVRVTVLCPGPVPTEFGARAGVKGSIGAGLHDAERAGGRRSGLSRADGGRRVVVPGTRQQADGLADPLDSAPRCCWRARSTGRQARRSAPKRIAGLRCSRFAKPREAARNRACRRQCAACSEPVLLSSCTRSIPRPAGSARCWRKRGHPLDVRRPRFGDPLPETMDGHAGAVIFGGPQSANDDDEFVRREIDWIGVPLQRQGSRFSASASARR